MKAASGTCSFGYVPGKMGEEFMVCQLANRLYSQGCIWIGCNPFSFGFPLAMTEILMFFLVSRTFLQTLKSFRQSILSCQILAGLVLGKSILGNIVGFRNIFFPPAGKVTLETMANVGFMVHLFVVGLQIDTNIVRKMGKDAAAVGIASFLIPMMFCAVGIIILPGILPPYNISVYFLLFIATSTSMSSFAGTTGHLSDLQILNSDIGRIATLASMINDTCNFILYISISSLIAVSKVKKMNVTWCLMWNMTVIFFLIYVFRPLMIRYAKNLPEGQGLKESHFVAIVIQAMLFGLLMESLGMPAGFGSLLYGSIIPDGPPLGTTLVDKLDTFCTGILLPAKFGLAGASVNIYSFVADTPEMVVAVIITLGYVGKFIGVLLSGLFFNIPFWDSISLSLIMCCKGVVEVSIFITLKEAGLISEEAYTIMLFSMLIVTGMARPLIARFYDPWRRYSGQQVNSILHSNQRHLRVLVCIYGEDNVGPIVDLLSTSNPTKESPLSVSVINLIELQGRSSSVLERNVYKGGLTSMIKRSQHIANAFDHLVRIYQGSLALQHFTSVAPYATMHSDICTIAVDVQAHIIIIPFHKQKQIDGSCNSNLPAVRTVNQNVIKNAPSTVGILIDRSYIAGALRPIGKANNYLRIIVLFLGGADDREALAYGSRMIGHPKVSLTLVWLRSYSQINTAEAEGEDNLDIEIIEHFRANTVGNDRVTYREEVAKDAVGTTRVLRSLEGDCDLCLVGRYHPYDSPLTQGMISDWSECPELGALGESLSSSSDFPFSVLVVKQEAVDEPEFWRKNSFSYSV